MSTFKLLERPENGERKRTGAYLGYRGYAVILAILKRPGTPDHVATTTGAGMPGIRRLLRQFHTLRLLHIVGWVKPSNGFPAPIYKLGEGIDEPAPLTRAGQPMPHCGRAPRMQRNVVAFASLIHALAEETPAAKLAIQSGMAASRLRELLQYMRRPEIRLVHIAAYEPQGRLGGPAVRLYQYNPGASDARYQKPRKHTRSRAPRLRDLARDPWAQMTLTLKREAGMLARAS
jgi:hypothetical protein